MDFWFSTILATLFFVLGASIASFAGLAYSRLAAMSADASILKTISFPRSHCDHCHKVLNPLELFPIVGWLLNKGRCSSCRQKIPALFPGIEIALGALSASVFIAYRDDLVAVLTILALLWALSIIAAIDFAIHIIPDELSWPLLFLGLLYSPFEPDIQIRVAGAAFGFGITWSMMALTGFIAGEDNVAWGDITLGAVTGAWLGIFVAPFSLLAFCVFFILISLPALKRGQKGEACAPAFGLALIVVAPFHDQILKIYG